MIYSGGFVYNFGGNHCGTIQIILTTEVNVPLGMSLRVKHALYLKGWNAYLCSEQFSPNGLFT